MSERNVIEFLHDRRNGRIPAKSVSNSVLTIAPDQPYSGCFSDDGVWIPPAKSTASRMPPARSKGHSRSYIVDPASNRVLVCESAMERDFAHILMTDRRVVDIRDQPPAVQYVDGEGKLRKHTFDFLATLVSGERVAYAVKPEAKVEKSGIKLTLAAIRAQVPGFADRIALRTERQITKIRGHNARTILRARRLRNQDDVREALSTVEKLHGYVRFGDLVATSQLEGRAWTALVCLIDEGVLELPGEPPLNDDAMVRLTCQSARKEG